MGAAQAEEERSSKRQRTEMNESIDFVRDKNYYLDDGNIILVAENTAFKIHKSVLSRHSIVFRDMFLLANGNSSSSPESHRDCEILRLSDSKQDMVCLLQTLYDNIVLSSDDLLKLSRLLRISNKYLIHRLLKRTLEIIEKAIPITYENYKASFGTPRWHAVYGHNGLNVGVAAITTGIDIFSPILYYRFSMCGNPSDLEILPASSIAKIVAGIKPTLDCLPSIFEILKARKSASDTCHSSTCRLAWEELSSTIESFLATPKWLYVPIEILIRMCRRKWVGECSSCRTARINLLDAEAKKIWDQLPQIYNVATSWDELRERYHKLKESGDDE